MRITSHTVNGHTLHISDRFIREIKKWAGYTREETLEEISKQVFLSWPPDIKMPTNLNVDGETKTTTLLLDPNSPFTQFHNSVMWSNVNSSIKIQAPVYWGEETDAGSLFITT